MFIKAPNARLGTGYVGDVNTSFRNGRQDAFRDYVDNFNFATQADALNNAENQRNADRTYLNFTRQLDMQKKQRDDLLDFAQAQTKIPQAQFEADVNFARLQNLYPQVGAIGQSQANTQVATQNAAENAAIVKSAQAENEVKDIPLITQADTMKTQQALGAARNTVNTQDLADSVQDTRQQLVDFTNGSGLKQVQDELLRRELANRRAQAQANNVVFDETQATQEVMSDPSFGDRVQRGYEYQIRQMQDHIAAGEQKLGQVTPTQVRTAKQPTAPKLAPYKPVSTNLESEDFITELRNQGAMEVTPNVFVTEDGVYRVIGGKPHVIPRPVGADGNRVSTQEFLRMLGYPNAQAKANDLQQNSVYDSYGLD